MQGQRKGSLYASFLSGETDEQVLQLVEAFADSGYLTHKYVFLLEESSDHPVDHPFRVLTYNASTVPKLESNITVPFTLRVHRKKNTNTLYTINALNETIKKENNGVLDKKYKLNWENYSDSFLLVKGGVLVKVPLRVHKIFSIEE